MPARIDLVVKYTDGVETAYNTFSYYSAPAFSNPTNMTALANAFITNVIADWKDFMPDDIVFEEIVARSPSYPFPVTLPVSENGSLDLPTGSYMPAWLPLNLKKNVVSNVNGDDGLPYVGLRPVRFGRVFLSWMPESFNTADGFDVPADAVGTAWLSFINSANDSVLLGSDTWFPVVPGEPLPAAGSLPARPSPVMGVIGTFIAKRFTKLGTRQV